MTVDRTEAGTTWGELAKLDPLAAVLDPGDAVGAKNRTIDRVHKHALASVLKDLHHCRALDFGCGTGRLSAWLDQRGAIVQGVDITPEMIEAARRRELANATFSVIDGRTLPFAEASFDVAVSAYVLQYYLEDSSVARQIVRVLRPEAVFVAIEQTTQSDIGRGGDTAAYRQMLLGAGFAAVEARVVRVSDSRIVGAVSRYPILSRMPFLSLAIQAESHHLRNLPFVHGRYADTMFVCRVGPKRC